MINFDVITHRFSGPQGTLTVPADDDITRKLAMLIDGECLGPGPKHAAKKYGFSRQRYFQLRQAFIDKGALGLLNQRRGPKTHYRRSKEVVCQAIRHRCLDPDASSEVIAQKLRQCGFTISKRSIDRIFDDYGLQKKTLHISTRPRSYDD